MVTLLAAFFVETILPPLPLVRRRAHGQVSPDPLASLLQTLLRSRGEPSDRRLAATSISIFTRGSASPHVIMVAAGGGRQTTDAGPASTPQSRCHWEAYSGPAPPQPLADARFGSPPILPRHR